MASPGSPNFWQRLDDLFNQAMDLDPSARAQFVGRAVKYLAEERGITQFIDLGSGLPGVGNVHEVAQDVVPSARVVYVDNDPIVHVHGRALLTMEGLRRRRAEILGVARKRRAHRIAVFGSVARGEARPDSDLDLLVDFEPGTSLLDHVGLFQDLEELLGVGVDVVTRSALKPRDDHIRAEAVDL